MHLVRRVYAGAIFVFLVACGGNDTVTSGQPATTPPTSGAAAGTGASGVSAGAGGAAGRAGSPATTVPPTAGTTSSGAAGTNAAGSGGSLAAGGSGGAGASGGAGDSGGVGGDTSAAGAGGASAAGAGGAPATSAIEPKLPMKVGTCPMLRTGSVTINGSSVQLWVGEKKPETKGMILIYWHVTGGSSSETTTFGPTMADITKITADGGIVAAPNGSTRMGSDTGNGVWYTGDFKIADQVVACAVEQLNIDTHRIYTMGGSAGALQAGIMVYQRSSYLAASVPNSGGYTIGGNTLEDPSHVPAVMTLHGAPGSDVVIVDFSQQSLVLDVDVAKKGGFAVDCNHGGGHVSAPAGLRENGFQFLLDHPFGVSPEPYANGLPMGFPTYCKIIKATDTAPAGCCARMNAAGGAGGAPAPTTP